MTKKAKSRGTPKRAPQKKHAPTTALVRSLERRLEVATGKRPPRMQVLPALPEVERTLTENEVSLGELGLVEVKLTPAEEAILSELPPESEILIKPTGHPYLSHPTYTRWFNRAFGRTGWSLVPASKPMKANNAVVCAYVLHVHKQPVALAWGEQEFFETNRDQSYGDALESTVASALRRCAKRLGVGLELWDRAWIDRFMAEHAIEVWVQGPKDDKARKQYRRPTDRPFWNEVGGRGRQQSAREEMSPDPGTRNPPPAKARTEEFAGHHRQSADPITEKQARRLWVITRNSGRSDDEVSAWLQDRYGLKSSKEIPRNKYDEICEAIEATADLPKGRA